MSKKLVRRFNRLPELTVQAVRRQKLVNFAGFLVDEDDDEVYIADPQGTWMIQRMDIEYLEEWKPPEAIGSMKATGKPVRVGVREGATIHEIRPWKISKVPGGMGPGARKVVDQVFSLGGRPLQISDRAIAGEEQLADLERAFARRLGWDPFDSLTGAIDRRAVCTSSQTIVLVDGYCDVDDCF